MHGLAITYRKLKQYDDSIAICQEILKLDPDYAKVYFNLGLVYEEQGDWDKAIAQHRKAIDLNPDDYMVHYNLARAYDAVKDGSKAIEHLRKAESVANKENDKKAKNESKKEILIAGSLPTRGVTYQAHEHYNQNEVYQEFHQTAKELNPFVDFF